MPLLLSATDMLHFLQVADLHLGMRITRFPQEAVRKIQEARFQALEKVKVLASRLGPTLDAVVLAGDLFDDAAVDPAISRRAFNLLDSFPVPVLIIAGNHDPLQPGSLWELDPWNRPVTRQVRLLKTREPYTFSPQVTFFPCPVFRKTSTENPTQWIQNFPRDTTPTIRVGIAHGCVMDRPQLPLDDHPISPTACDDLQLDYMALGHWHRQQSFPSREPRMAYSGVHEPMRFAGDPLGWHPYSSGGLRDEFLDAGTGNAISVKIAEPGAVPQLEVHTVAHLTWLTRREQLHSEQDFDQLVARVAEMPQPELTILRLTLEGQLPAQVLLRLDELRGVLGRFLVHDLDDRHLLLEPESADFGAALGEGLLNQVYEKLQQQLELSTLENRDVVQRAMLLMYRLAARVREQSA